MYCQVLAGHSRLRGWYAPCMLRPPHMLVALCSVCLCASAQAPSTATMNLSLKTMSKALAGCRESYTRVYPGTNEPFLRRIVGEDNYNKDMLSLGHAEAFTSFLIAHPDKLSGKMLVAILSTSDDFSVGVGSTRSEVLRHMVIDRGPARKANELSLAAEALNDCQKSLFNAGDDFVELVMNYVGAEDDALARTRR
jgi:hypothetical protein